MAKTPCIYHVQGKCRRGDKCFYKHDDKASSRHEGYKKDKLPSSKEEGEGLECRTTSDRSQSKFACIAKKQSRATSSPEGSSVSMKRVRFRKNPQVFEVTAVGRQVPVDIAQESSQLCTEHPMTFLSRPRLNSMKRRWELVSPRRPWSFMIPTLHQVVGFVVGMTTLVTSSVKNADLISGPQALRNWPVSLDCHSRAKGRC